MLVGSIIHVAVLPFCDLVVLSTGTAWGIVFNNIMSVKYLGESFVWSYDGPAFALIIGGSLAIVFLSDYSESKFTPAQIRELIFSRTTLVFVILYLVVTISTVIQYFWHKKQIANFNESANVWLD